MLPGFNMKNKLIALAAFCLLMSLTAQAQESDKAASQTFHIRLPETIETTNLSINYYLTGAFGGYSSFIQGKPRVWDYEIDTSQENQPATSLKVVVYCPGYQVETLDFPSLAAVQERKAELRLKPLGTVPFSGRVLLPETLSSDEVRVSVRYSAFWVCDFFGLIDCLVANFGVTSTDLTEGGRFKVALPDFAHDPVVSSFSNPGDFNFQAVERKSGRFLFRLKPQGNPARQEQILIADSYSGAHIFIPEVEN